MPAAILSLEDLPLMRIRVPGPAQAGMRRAERTRPRDLHGELAGIGDWIAGSLLQFDLVPSISALMRDGTYRFT